jgi:hypothetical protein
VEKGFPPFPFVFVLSFQTSKPRFFEYTSFFFFPPFLTDGRRGVLDKGKKRDHPHKEKKKRKEKREKWPLSATFFFFFFFFFLFSFFLRL